MDINNQIENKIVEVKTLLAKIFNKIVYRSTVAGVINYPSAVDFMLLIETAESSKQAGFRYGKDGIIERLLNGDIMLFSPEDFDCHNLAGSRIDKVKVEYLEKLEGVKNYLRFIYKLLKEEQQYKTKDLLIILGEQAQRYKLDYDEAKFYNLVG